MKKFLILFLLSLSCLLPVEAKRVPGEKVGVEFETLIYDFGTVKADSGPVKHSFGYTVTGDSPVAILSAQANCGCTTPEYDRKPATPGGKGAIKVSFLTAGQKGEIDKEVRVRLRNGAGRSESVTLRIRGVVVP